MAVRTSVVATIGCAVAVAAALVARGDEAAGAAAGRVDALAARLDAGLLRLRDDPRFGVLPDLLAALEIPVSSQVLVFSKTSFQSHRIDPAHPRAVYFNDDTYVGWLPDSDLIELASIDPDEGAVFHTLEAGRGAAPRLARDTDQCVICHVSQRTQGVPGFLVRSVMTNPAGRFVSGAASFVTDDASPLVQRWGGWYVTGTHGDMRHMGNTTYSGHTLVEPFDVENGANLTRLPDRVAANRYPVATSDIVALLVLEHQSQAHNLMTRAAAESRAAARLDAELGLPAGSASDATRLRVAQAGDRLLRCLLLADAITFTSPVRGTSGFAAEFSARGPHDEQGRSLHQLDLDRRLFARRLSHLVHGGQFARLPEPVKRHLGGRLHEILCAGREVAGFGPIDRDDREAIASILAATEPEFWWTFVVPPPIGAIPTGAAG
jgi:hypothetical protein